MLVIIFITSLIILFSFSIIEVHAWDYALEHMFLEKQKYPVWYVGKDISAQNYLYHVCDYSIKFTLNHATPCYQVQLDFIDLLQEQNGRTWIVQAIFTSENNHKNWFSILHISDDFSTITSDGTSMNYVTSLLHTVFYLQHYANMHKPQLLKIGASWGPVIEYLSPVPHLVVDRFTTVNLGNNSLSVYRVGFDVSKYNSFFIQEKIPFPIESTLYDFHSPDTDPRILYQVKLLSISVGSKNVYIDPSLDLEPTQHYPTLLSTKNLTQTLKNNTDQNYTHEINFTSEDVIIKKLKMMDGNFTLNSTR